MSNEDKVSVSLTVKVGLPNYGSADAQVSYTSAVTEGETPDEAYERVLAFVSEKIAEHQTRLNALAEGEEPEAKADKKPSQGAAFLNKVKENKTEEASTEEVKKPALGKAFSKGTAPKVQVKEEVPAEEIKETKPASSSTSAALEAIKAKYGNKGATAPSNGSSSLLDRLKRQ